MDIFGSIKNGIDLAIQVRDLIEGIQGAPDTLKRLGVEIRELKVMLDDCRDILSKTTEPTETLLPLLQNVQKALKSVEAAILPLQIKARKDGTLSSWVSLKVTLKEREIEKYMADFQRHKVLLSLINASVTSRSQLSSFEKLQELEVMAKNQGTRLSENETQVFFKFMQQQIEYGRMMQEVYQAFNQTINVLFINEAQLKTEKALTFQSSREPDGDAQSEWTCQLFLDSLSVPNINDDRENVTDADSNTCRWIYDHPAYSAWYKRPESATLHLAGKMGCGKSVLTKEILKTISKGIPSPPTSDDDVAVLFYFCSRVKRPGETTSALLEALIYQFLDKRRDLFRALEKQTDLLGSQNLSGKDATRSLRSLWKILGILFRSSRHFTIYCVVDALDECDINSTKAFLAQYKDPQDADKSSSKAIKFFISSRNSHEILNGITRTPRVPVYHLPITPAIVTPDIELVLNKDLETIAEDLCLDIEEQKQLQVTIIEKADGMFQWVNTALKVIGDADGSTFESLMQLVQSLPTELQDLYNRCLLSLLESLEKSDVELIRKLLAWLLLATRPLTISELMIALAIRADDVTLPPRNRMHKSIGRFIWRCLAPFVEIVPSKSEGKGNENPLDVLKDPEATVRPVHNSAQEFLLDVCTAETASSPLSVLKIDRVKAHEDIASACLTYLRAAELQLGWLGQKKPDPFGMVLADDGDKELLKTRIKENVFLRYSAQNWFFHARQCADRGKGDIYDLALDFFKNRQEGVWCASQVRQYLSRPERETYWPPPPTLLAVVDTDSAILTERYLASEQVDINVVDLTGSNALMVSGGHDTQEDCPDAPEKIGKLLMDRGVDLSSVDKFGKTAMHWAASNGHGALLRLFLEKNADTNVHDVDGDTPMHASILADTSDALLLFLSTGADYETTDNDGCTPLHWAARNGRKEMVEILLDFGAQVSSLDHDLWTPIHFAAARGHEDIVQILIKHRANLHGKTIGDSNAIHLAAENGFWRTVKLLHEAGVSIHDLNDNQATALLLASEGGHEGTVRLLLSLGADPDIHASSGDTALHVATVRGSANIVKMLIDNNALVDVHASRGWTPLQIAVSKGNFEIASLLVPRLRSTKHDLTSGKTDTECTAIDCVTETGFTALHQAAFNGNPQVLRLLLEAGADVNKMTAFEETPLHWASEAGKIESIKILLEAGANPDPKNKIGQTPLYLAAEQGNSELVQHFLATKVEVDHQSTSLGFTPLQIAADGGHHRTVDLLLNAGALANHVALDGFTPLHGAARNGDLKCCELLIRSGAKINAVARSAVDDVPHTPFSMALRGIHTKVIDYLLSTGKKLRAKSVSSPDSDLSTELENQSVPSVTDISSFETVHFLLGESALSLVTKESWLINFKLSDETSDVLEYLLRMNHVQINQKNSSCWTFLHWAALSGSSKAVEMLLSKGHDLNVKTKVGKTVLHLATQSANACQILELLLSHPAQLNVNERDEDGLTALHYAGAFGNREMVEFLLEKGADITAKTRHGRTVLLVSINNQDTGPFDFLLRETPRTSVDERRNNGGTCLHKASHMGKKHCVEKLLQAGADINLLDESGWQALHHAVEGGNVDVVHLLLTAGANVNHVDKRGQTPLHVAAKFDREDILQALLQRGAKSVADYNGWTPRDVAIEHSLLYLWELSNGVVSSPPTLIVQEKVNAPTSWSRDESTKEMQVSADGLTVELGTVPTPDLKTTETGGFPDISVLSRGYSLRTDFCIPAHIEDYYFEVKVLEDGGTGAVAIGFSDHTFSLQKLPGWSRGKSWGYHGDDAKFHDGTNEPKRYETYTAGDTIGLGFNRKTHSIYITKNGKYQGVAAENVRGQLYPTVGLLNAGSKVQATFGVTPPHQPLDMSNSTPEIAIKETFVTAEQKTSDVGDE